MSLSLEIGSQGQEFVERIKSVPFFRIPGDKTSLVYLLSAIIACWRPCTIDNFHFCEDANDILAWMQKEWFASVKIDGWKVEIIPHNQFPTDLKGLGHLRSSIVIVWGVLTWGSPPSIQWTTPGWCDFTVRPIDRHMELLDFFWMVTFPRADGSFETSRNSMIGRQKRTSPTFSCSTEKFGPSVWVTIHALIMAAQSGGSVHLVGISSEPSILIVSEYLRKSFPHRRISIDCVARTADIVDWTHLGERRSIPNIRLPTDVPYVVTVACLCAAIDRPAVVSNVDSNIRKEKLFKHFFKTLRIGGSEFLFTFRFNEWTGKLIFGPSPKLPTDCAPALSALMALKWIGIEMTDEVYDRRDSHISELRKIGITNIFSRRNTINVKPLSGARKTIERRQVVDMNDIRSAWALLVAGVGTHQRILARNARQLLRWYGWFISQLQANWFDVRIVNEGDWSIWLPFRTGYSQYPHVRLDSEEKRWRPVKIWMIWTCDAQNIWKALSTSSRVRVIKLWNHLFHPAAIEYELGRILWLYDDWRQNIESFEKNGSRIFRDPIRFWLKDANQNAIVANNEKMDREILHSISQLDSVIAVLGYNEVWIDSNSGFIYNRLPIESVRSGKLFVTPKYLSKEEILNKVELIVERIRFINPRIRIIFWVSPIPSNFSYRIDKSDYLSSKYEMVSFIKAHCAEHGLGYLDFFETIDMESRHSQSHCNVWQDDGRHLSKEAIVRMAGKCLDVLDVGGQSVSIRKFFIPKVGQNGRIIWNH